MAPGNFCSFQGWEKWSPITNSENFVSLKMYQSKSEIQISFISHFSLIYQNISVLYINVYINVLCGCRGLDVQPTQILKFERQKDVESTSVLNIVYSEEITHVAAGMKWFNYICENSQPKLVSSAAAA